MPVVKKYYTVSEKLAILKILNRRRLDNNSSYREIARELGVDPSQLRRWEQQSAKLEEFYAKRKRNAKALHDGYKSQLSHIEEELLEYIFEGCEQGLPMTIRLVTAKASELDDTFRRKSMVAKEHAIRRFVKAHGLVHRVHTHESQRSLAEAEEQATEFVLQMRPLLAERNRSQDYIINMDQTPIFFSMVPRTTLSPIGARTVHVRTSTSSTMRATVSVCITASGRMLPPLIIFKGKPNGRIQREFTRYNQGAVYVVQENAWMDERVMKIWIERVLTPYVATAPQGVRPLLILDSYRCHQMPSIVQLIEEEGTDLRHIPAGCTGLCQPINVGIAKPLKDRVRHSWEDWMVDQGTGTRRFSPPPRALLSEWVVRGIQSLENALIQNSWRHGRFSFFDEDLNIDVPEDVHNNATDNANNEVLATEGTVQV